jgi:hypothetical protein
MPNQREDEKPAGVPYEVNGGWENIDPNKRGPNEGPDFKIHYDDGSVLDSRKLDHLHNCPTCGAPPQTEEARMALAVAKVPADGVQCIIQRDKDWGRNAVYGGNYYVYDRESGLWSTTGDIGPTLRRIPFLKIGRITPREKWQALLDRAVADPEFDQAKTPRRRKEDWDAKTGSDRGSDK